MDLFSKKGYDLPLVGSPSNVLQSLSSPRKINLVPSDFPGIKPKLLVKEGDSLIKGQPVYFDKNNPNIMFTTFFSGNVDEIIYGPRRSILKINISTVDNNDQIPFSSYELNDIVNLDKKKIREILASSGLWPCIRRRPFSKIAKLEDLPKSIFITTESSAPFSPKLSVLSDNIDLDGVQAGINALHTLASVPINMVFPKDFNSQKFTSLKNVVFHTFEGKHPSGNVGYHIANIDPIKDKDDCVWYVSLQDINSIGLLFLNGILENKKIISTGGLSGLGYNKYYLAYRGALVSDLGVLPGNGKYQIISGDPLSGKIISNDDSISFYDDTISFIKDDVGREFMGWLNPGLNKFSLSRTFLSSLFSGKNKKLTSAMNGSLRTIIPIGAIEKMCVLDVMPTMLLKAILSKDIEMMEELGIYECAPEDFSLCAFSDPSKMDIMGIIKNGLDLIEAEG